MKFRNLNSPIHRNLLQPEFFFKIASNCLLLACILVNSNALFAQLNCFNSNDPCTVPVKYPDKTFICIDANVYSTFSTAKFANLLLGNNEAMVNPQYLVIRGTLSLESGSSYTFAPGSEIIFVNEQSGIEVQGNASLILNGSYLHGCSRMWYGIKANYSGTIKSINSTIADAWHGIWGFGTQTRITVINSTFQRDVYGIAFGDNLTDLTSSYPGVRYSDGIYGNEFWGEESLLTNTFGFVVPLRGMICGNVTNGISIGLPNGSPNIFHNYVNLNDSPGACIGIESYNTSMIVKNSRFINFSNSTTNTNGGILFKSSNGSHKLTVVGTGDNTPMFQYNKYAIAGFNINLDASNINFKNSRFGIYITRDPEISSSLIPMNIVVHDCKFETYSDGGFVLNSNIPIVSSKIHIYNNIFTDNSGIGLNPGGTTLGYFLDRLAIRVLSGMPSVLNNCHIKNNTIDVLQTATLFFPRSGIQIGNCKNITIETNNITFSDNFASSQTFFEGISLKSCENTNLFSNRINGNNNAFVNTASAAISNRDSRRTNFNCNRMSYVYDGIRVEGPGSNYAILTQNVMDYHSNGLDLSKDAVIGDQNKGENKWIGSYGTNEGYLEWDDAMYGTYNPNISLHRNIIGSKGVFYINSPGISDPNDIYWASPRKVGTTQDYDVWFTPSNILVPSNQINCLATNWVDNQQDDPGVPALIPNALTFGDYKILDNNYPDYKGTAWQGEAKLRLYERLNYFPNLRPTGFLVSTWYDSEKLTNLGKLKDLEENLLQIQSIANSNRSNFINTFNEYSNAILGLDSLITSINQCANPNQLADLYAQQQIKSSAVISKQQQYFNLVNDFRVSGKNRAVSLKNDLNQISPSSVAETNLKTILGIQLDYLIGSQIKLDSAQIVAISEIANQCRYDGGWAVVLARQLILGEYVDDLLCASHSRDAEFNDQLHKDILVEVYPNPSSGLLNINLKNSSSSIICQIYKFDGTMVKSWVTDQVNQSIDISNFSNGVYLLSVSGKGIQTSTTTFILNH